MMVRCNCVGRLCWVIICIRSVCVLMDLIWICSCSCCLVKVIVMSFLVSCRFIVRVWN